MKHPEIDDRSIAEHYVAGKLPEAEVALFEEHYLNCPQCIQAVEDAERLQSGLGTVAAESLVVRQAVLTRAWEALSRRSGLALAAALLVLSLLPASLIWQRVGSLGADLESARRQLAEERRPRVNTPILALVPTRAGEQPLQQISLRPEPEWIVLAIELGDTARLLYEAKLTADHGSVVLESPSLEPSFRGTLAISLHSSILPPGEYLLTLVSDDQRLAFPLRVTLL